MKDPLTIAVTGSSAEPVQWSSALGKVALSHALSAVNAGDGRVTLIVARNPESVSIDLTPLRGDEVEQDPQLATVKVANRMSELRERLIRAAATTSGLDALGLLVRALRATPTGGTVVMGTSFAPTVDPVDLRRLGWDFETDKVITDLKSRGLIPDATGRRILFAGLGVTFGSQPPLSIPGRSKVKQLAMAICHAAKAPRRRPSNSCRVARYRRSE